MSSPNLDRPIMPGPTAWCVPVAQGTKSSSRRVPDARDERAGQATRTRSGAARRRSLPRPPAVGWTSSLDRSVTWNGAAASCAKRARPLGRHSSVLDRDCLRPRPVVRSVRSGSGNRPCPTSDGRRARQRAAALHGQRKEGWGAVGRPRKLSYTLRDAGAGRANPHRGRRSVRGRLITATPGTPTPTAGDGSVFIKNHLTCSGGQQLEGTSVASPTDHGKVNPSVTALLAVRERPNRSRSQRLHLGLLAQGRKVISTSSTCGTECWTSAPGGEPEQPLSVREPACRAAPTWRTTSPPHSLLSGTAARALS